jgi:2-polyprenyl-6-hydroxyphenyl methylase/3-demethylubiquinone-9 3-methyltransferase
MAGRTKPGRESTVDATEVARFSALAAEWWDARGKMAVLHRLNPVRLGLRAEVVGADPSQANIEAAKLHAGEAGVAIDYRVTTAEALADAGERFDIVLAMEVVEHVADLSLFVRRCAEMVKPGGLMIAATLNRTFKSFALAIVGAEYVLRWLPRGTHQWDKFVTPNELEATLERHGLRVIDETGVIYDLLADRWQLSSDMDVNYMVVAERAPS